MRTREFYEKVLDEVQRTNLYLQGIVDRPMIETQSSVRDDIVRDIDEILQITSGKGKSTEVLQQVSEKLFQLRQRLSQE